MTRRAPKAGPESLETAPVPPSDLQVLESEDGEVIILSFSLASQPTRTLTHAESEVAALVLKGLSNADIAKLRGCSKRTVANQVASVFRKLGVKSRLELVAFAPLLHATPGWE